MKIILKYIFYYFGIKLNLIKLPSPKINEFIKNKKTLHILIDSLFKYWYIALKNIPLMIKYRDLLTNNTVCHNENDFLKMIKYYKEKRRKTKIIVMNSYCEKPLNCPDRYKIYCRGMKNQCNFKCDFKEYPGFSNGAIEYRFMTDDESVAQILKYSLIYASKHKSRVFLIMSICNFSSEFVKYFGLFNVSILVYKFKRNKLQCNNIEQYFAGDAGIKYMQNSLSINKKKNLNAVIANIINLLN